MCKCKDAKTLNNYSDEELAAELSLLLTEASNRGLSLTSDEVTDSLDPAQILGLQKIIEFSNV